MKHASLGFILFMIAACNKEPKTAVQSPAHEHNVVVSAKNMTNNHVTLNDTQIKLANIKTQQVKQGDTGQTISLNATLTADETLTQVISSRASGRIEKLYFKETGRAIRKGEPLYTLYSETLLTLQREYLLAREQYEGMNKDKHYLDYLKASENKLLLYGLSKKQIDQLANSKTAQQSITFLSPADGWINEVSVTEGQYISEGGILYRIEDLNQLWVEAEIYPNEIEKIKAGDKISVRIGDDRTEVEAVVLTILPEYKTNTQTATLRAKLPNKELRWKPGTQAQVFLNSHSSTRGIVIPSEGVIRSENGAQVFVLTDKNTFSSRTVSTGNESANTIEITEGLSEGETVVISGAYLIYSELILKH